MDYKGTKPVNPKGNKPWIFTGRTDAEAPILWPPDVKNWFTGKDPDVGKYWREEEEGTVEDEMVGWHDWLNGHGFELTMGDSEGQGSLACCSPRGHKELDTTEQPNRVILLLICWGTHQTCVTAGDTLGALCGMDRQKTRVSAERPINKPLRLSIKGKTTWGVGLDGGCWQRRWMCLKCKSWLS